MYKKLIREIIFLKNIRQLLKRWGLSEADWFLNDGFFLKPFLDTFYDLTTKDHWHVLVNKEKLPWQISVTGQVIPPAGSEYLKDYMDFLNNNPELMIDTVGNDEFQRKIKGCEKIQIDKDLILNQIKPAKALYNILYELNIKPDCYHELIYKAKMYVNKVQDKEVLEILKNIENERIKKVIDGEPVNLKNVIGEVKFIWRSKGIENIEDKIIVIEEILPKHLSLILKARGVISVVGGQTGHSAIACREFNKPCLVGVTRAFYDLREGDLVELDGIKGQIKIIKPYG